MSLAPPAEGTVLETRRWAPGAHWLRVRAEREGRPLRWRAGQHVRLLPPPPLRPLYLSIASAPDPARPGQLELLVGTAPGSELDRWLETLGPGASLRLEGPAGTLGVPQAGQPLLLVAAGTGITPLRAILQATLRALADARPPVLLLFGARSPERLWFHEEFETLAAREDRFDYWPTLSGPAPGWAGRRGRVQRHLEEALARLTPSSAVLCGPPKMVRQVREALLAGGLPPDRVASEG